MLSVIDLMEAGTLDKKMAAYFMAVLAKGKSFLVGSKPGGTGKTTVMAALLNFIPDVDIVPTEDSQVIRDGLRDGQRKCYLAHEIGEGSWYAYIWGEDVQEFLELTRNHVVAGNLHADNIEDVLAHEGFNGSNLTKIDLLIFLRLVRNGGYKRRIGIVYENQGDGKTTKAFRPIFEWDGASDTFKIVNKPKLASSEEIREAERLLEQMMNSRLKTIEEVRSFVVQNYISPGP